MWPPAGNLFEAGVSEGTGLPCLFAQALTRQDRSQLGVCRQGFWEGCPGEGRPTARPGHRFPCCLCQAPMLFPPARDGNRVSGGRCKYSQYPALGRVLPSEARQLGCYFSELSPISRRRQHPESNPRPPCRELSRPDAEPRDQKNQRRLSSIIRLPPHPRSMF